MRPRPERDGHRAGAPAERTTARLAPRLVRRAVFPLLCASLVFLLPEITAMADQTDARLDSLFMGLAAAPGPAEAQVIEARIWSIWLEAHDPELDRLMTRGITAMERGDGRGAKQAFDQLIEARPDFAEAWNKRATLFYLLELLPESIADIDRTLALEPRHFGALSGLALIREQQGKPFEALEALEKVQRIHPKMPGLDERIERLTGMLGEAI